MTVLMLASHPRIFLGNEQADFEDQILVAVSPAYVLYNTLVRVLMKQQCAVNNGTCRSMKAPASHILLFFRSYSRTSFLSLTESLSARLEAVKEAVYVYQVYFRTGFCGLSAIIQVPARAGELMKHPIQVYLLGLEKLRGIYSVNSDCR